MTDSLDLVRSAYPGMIWPAVPPQNGSLALALQFQLGRSQWLSAEDIAANQERQLHALLRHAHATVPFYRERLTAAGYRADIAPVREWFVTLPLLTRGEVLSRGKDLHSSAVPSAHAPVASGHTSGSTGIPVSYLSTAVTRCFWQAFNLRDQLWHRRDLSRKFVGIRPDRGVQGPQGLALTAWGASTTEAFQDGPAALLHSANPIDRQLDWLVEQDPAYLLTLASNLLELAREMRRRGVRLPDLREACTYGDALAAEERAECGALLGVPVTDIYSAQETGYIALQCPGRDCYHVQAEGLIVEILDEQGRACLPGAMGRLVLTTLHNFAMPFIRYEIGDYAEAGAPCPCGRGLPVIRRILGRQRNMARAPDGRRYYPSFPAGAWQDLAPIRQLQLVQKSLTRIEARVVAARALGADEERALADALRRSLGHPYEISVARADSIARTASGKYEDFVCEV